MAKPWAQVADSAEFKALAPDQQEAARAQYFDQVVAPRVPKDQLDAARSQFDAQTGPKAKPESPTLMQRLTAPQDSPISIENTIRRGLGAPQVGQNPGYEKALSVDMPFADILPGGATLGNAVAREGGGLVGVGKAIGKGAVNVAKDVADFAGGPVKYLLRGGEQQVPQMQRNIETFRQAGAEPSVGQATGRRFPQALESALSKVPGGAGRMYTKGASQQSDLGKKVAEAADSLATDSTPFTSGRTIDTGLKGFVNRFKQQQGELYGKLDQYIPQNAPVSLSNTQKTLAGMNQDIKGAANVSKFFKNAKIQTIEDALNRDARGQGGALPYEAVKKLRTLVGNELENGSLVSDVPRSKWKALYAALSSDLEGAAKATGNAAAVKAMDRANQYSRAGYDRIDSVLDNVQSRKVYEDIYKAATNPADMKSGASKIQGVMKSLKPEERDVVRSTFIRDLGRAKAGAQNAAGDEFSSQTFLTQWNNVSPQAKAVMFSGGEANQVRKDLDAIAEAADSIKKGSKVFANPSGTTPAAAQLSLGGAAVAAAGAAVHGNFVPAAVLVGGLAATNLSARLMTYPRFVNWLASAIRMPSTQFTMRLPQMLNMLRANTKDADDSTKQDIDNYIGSVTGAPQ
jgi:hypothetical protein